MKYTVQVEGRSHDVDIRRGDGGWWIAIDGEAAELYSGERVGAAEWLLQEGGRARTIGVAVKDEQVALQVDGHALSATVVDPRKAALRLAGGGDAGEMRTQMPGAVVRVLVSEGQEVASGQVLVVVEAMKMENEFKAPFAGTVSAVHVEAGQALEAGALLITVEEG